MGEELKLQCLKPTVKGGGGLINVWGGFSMHGMGAIHKINDIMDQTIYKFIIKDILQSYSEEYLPLNWISVVQLQARGTILHNSSLVDHK